MELVCHAAHVLHIVRPSRTQEQISRAQDCCCSSEVAYSQESELDSCTALRHVLVGGEALPPVLAARFGQRLPNAHLHNAYGPTETTVDATGTVINANPRIISALCVSVAVIHALLN